MRKSFLALILVSLSAATAASAQPQPQRSGTPAEQAASRDSLANPAALDLFSDWQV